MTVAPTPPLRPALQHHRSRWVLLAVLAFILGGLAVGLLYHFEVLGGSSSSASGTEGSGVPATQTRAVSAFHSVELVGRNNVVIHVGEKRSVVVRADDNLLGRVTTKVASGKLVIGNTPGSLTTKSPMSVVVDVPTLSAVTLAGGGNIVVVGSKAERLTVMLSGGGNVTGRGIARLLDVTLSGAGTASFTQLPANSVHAVLSGSGTIYVTATGRLDAAVPGSGTIIYSGNPRDVTKSVTGSGAIAGS